MLCKLPNHEIESLPLEDARAIDSAVGKRVKVVELQVEFTDAEGDVHWLWVKPEQVADWIVMPNA